MQTVIDVGPAPLLEPRAQPGSVRYWDQAMTECECYITMLRRHFGAEPAGARLCLRVQTAPLVRCLTVVCIVHETHPQSVVYAHQCRYQAPHKWDDEAQSAVSTPLSSTDLRQ